MLLSNQSENVDADSASLPSHNTMLDEYGQRILRSLRKIIRAVDIHSRKLNQHFHITTPQLICLHCLYQEGPMTLSRLANEVSLGASTTNGIVDRLEAKGLLSRTRSRIDRRKVELAVTEAGQKLIQSAPVPLQDSFCDALRRLPELEQAAITLSLERVVELMGAEHFDTSPNLVPDSHLSQPKEEPEGTVH